MITLKDIKCSFCICRDCSIGHRCIYKKIRCEERCKYPYIICKKSIEGNKIRIAI